MSISEADGYFGIVPFLRRIHALFIGFKMKYLDKAFSCVKTKTYPNFSVKVGESSNNSFSVYLMKDFVQTSVPFINMWNGMYRI